jgi:lipoprotein-releasing system ATP-binding protein
MSDEVIRAVGLSKAYRQGSDSTRVLKGVDLTVRRGELVAVVGPSGAGKTTLLYLLGGLARPSAGRVSLAGKEIVGLDDAELSRLRNLHLGFIFQNHQLLGDLSAEENVALPCRIAGKSSERSGERARQLLRELGLGHRLGHKPGELSGGEQQRVALARALANEPELLLADEPTGNLDKANSEAVFGLLMEVAKLRRQAVVMVTHNADLAARATRVLRMEDGLVVN